MTFFDLTHLMSMADLVATGVKKLKIDSRCSLKKEFIELVCMNQSMISYLIVKQVDSCHGCVCGPLT